jgi:uncharacterized protein (DUF1697 family)
MTTFVALLRAVNVGRTNRIKMVDLRAACVDDGLTDAVTHIQSGNIIFSSSCTASMAQLRVEKLIADRLGLSIAAVVRTAAELGDIALRNPFLADRWAERRAAGQDPSRLYVAFLGDAATDEAVGRFTTAPIGDDEVRVVGREVYVRYAIGAGTTKVTTGVWNRLGVPVTARNWNVTTTLAQMAADFTGP